VQGEAVSKGAGKDVHTDHPVALLEEGVNLTAFDHKWLILAMFCIETSSESDFSVL
jgi:hypothetical protein